MNVLCDDVHIITHVIENEVCENDIAVMCILLYNRKNDC